jgi:hypothetical protein
MSRLLLKKIKENAYQWFFLKLIIVFLFVFFLDFVIGRTLQYFYFKETSGLHYRTTYSLEKTEADVLVFGSSRANHNYIPNIFEDSLEMSFYNTGRDGTGIFYHKAVLKSVLKRYSPKVIILDYVGSFAKSENEYDKLSSLLPYYKTHKEIQEIVELKGPYERIKLMSEIYPYNSEILTIAIGNLEINKKRKPDNKGYIPLYKKWQAKIDSIDTFSTYEIDSNMIEAFKDFLNIAKKSGANFFVVYSPVFQKIKKKQEIEICKDMCNKENIIFWDFSNDTLFLNNSHFFQDVLHLNHNGANVFSNLIVKKIKQKININ